MVWTEYPCIRNHIQPPHPTPPAARIPSADNKSGFNETPDGQSPFLTGDVFILGLLAARLQVRAVLPLRLSSDSHKPPDAVSKAVFGDPDWIRILSGQWIRIRIRRRF